MEAKNQLIMLHYIIFVLYMCFLCSAFVLFPIFFPKYSLIFVGFFVHKS